MKLDHKTMALLVLLVGALVVGSYLLGESRTAGHASAVAAAQGATPAAPMKTAGAQLPPNHPPLNGPVVPTDQPANASHPFTHFRVGSRNVKDLLGYRRLVNNPDDDAAFLRVVNLPRRDIGATTLEKLG